MDSWFFGEEIAKLYLEPYNEKIWKRPLNEIDVDWIYTPGRVPIPDWREVIKAGAGVVTEGYKEQARFYYPLRGGIQALYNSVLEKAINMRLKIIKNERVENVRKVGKEWIINDRIKAKKIISTIPLNELVEALETQEHYIKFAKELEYNSVAVIGIALRKRAPQAHWIYIPDKDIIFHRYAWISNYSPYNTPDNNKYSAIIAEVTFPPRRDLNNKEIVERVIDGLEKLNVVNKKEILFSKMWSNRYGYPVHTIKSNRAREKILHYLQEELGIVTIGRWGQWRYLNMDKVFKQAKEISEAVLDLHNF